MLKKKIFSFMSAALLMGSVAYANPPETIQNAQGENIIISLREDIRKIHWDDPYITFSQFDQNKIEESRKAYPNLNVEQIANRGFSGDFLVVSAQRHGKIKTDYGEYEIVWTSVPERGSNAVVRVGDDYIGARIIDIDEKKSILYGDFSKSFSGIADVPAGALMAIAYIKKQNLFEGRPLINVKNEAKSLSTLSVEWSKVWERGKDGTKKVHGILSDGTELDVFATEQGNRYFALADGTRVFTKETANPSIVFLFCLDFDNHRSTQDVKFVTLGAIDSAEVGMKASYENVFANPGAEKKDFSAK